MERKNATAQHASAELTFEHPQAQAIREQLGRVLASPMFRGSHRSSKFLQYIVDSALHGQLALLKERTLGIEVFGRENGYDTGDDAVVRVTAGEVRRRLVNYYACTGDAGSVRIDLPSGSYAPEFHFLGPTSQPANGYPPSLATASVPAPLRTETSRRILSACFLIAIGWLSGTISDRYLLAPSRLSQNSSSLGPYSLYRELLGSMAEESPTPVEIALSNPRVFLYLGATAPNAWRSLPVAAPVSRDLQHILDRTSDRSLLSYPYRELYFAPRNYTGMGEATTAFSLGRLLQQLGRSPQITQARFLNWQDVRRTDLIVLGSPQMSDWVRQSLDSTDFTFARDSIQNAHPRAGEQSDYRRQFGADEVVDYGMIWMNRLSSGRPLLLIAGLLSEGTAGAGDFFCDPQRMRPVYEQLKAASKNGRVPDRWQVLLKITSRDRVPIDVSVVTVRVY